MNLIRVVASLSGMTMLSRITGLIRENLMARIFGASVETDAFFIAFRIPNLLRRLFAEGAFSQAFVPILGEFKAKRTEDETRDLIAHTATVLTWALLAITILGVIGAPWLVWLLAGGMKSGSCGESGTVTALATSLATSIAPSVAPSVVPGLATAIDRNAGFDLTVLMTRLMFPYILLVALAAGATGVLNTWRNFAIPAFTPVLLNITMIACAWFISPHVHPPVLALTLGVILGGMAQLAIQIPALTRIGMLPRIRLDVRKSFHHPGVRRVLRQMMPAAFAMSISQLSLIINTNIASHLQCGSVSWLTYADRLMEFPTALLGVTLGTVLLPSLSQASARGDTQEYSELLDWGMRLTFLIALPSSIALWFLGTPLTATLFHYGKFSAQAVEMTQRAVCMYGVGLTGLVLVKILAPGFYARQDVKTPFKIGLVVLVVTQLLNLVFVPLYAHAALALTVGLGACVNALLLFIGLRRRGVLQLQPGWGIFLARLAFGLLALGVLLWWVNHQFDWVALQQHKWQRIIILAGIVVAGCGTYFVALIAVGIRPSEFRRRI